MRTIGLIVLIIGSVPALLWVLLYYVRSNWKATIYGKQEMIFGSVFAMLYITILISLLWRIPDPVWIFGYILLDATLWVKLWLLVKAQRKDSYDKEILGK